MNTETANGTSKGVVIDGKAIAKMIHDETRNKIMELGITPRLVSFSTVENPSSEAYFNQIKQRAKSVGIEVVRRNLSGLSAEEVEHAIREAGQDPDVDGILLELPLAAGLDRAACSIAIEPYKDVDGAHPFNLGKLWIGDQSGTSLFPCTPLACLDIIRSTGVPLKGAHAIVIGQSTVVGRPVSSLLIDAGATVDAAHIFTKNTADLVREADIVVVAAGKPGLVKGSWIKPGAVVVDVGINVIGDTIVGDVEFEEAVLHAGFITPVPGGVGPVTIAHLLRNTLLARLMHRLAAGKSVREIKTAVA